MACGATVFDMLIALPARFDAISISAEFLSSGFSK